MINANELRIGNLLVWNPQLSNPKTTLPPVQVEVASLANNTIGYISPRVEHRAEPFEDDVLAADTAQSPVEEFEPIPLTPDLLANCGFEGRDDEWRKGKFHYRPQTVRDQQWSFAGETMVSSPEFLHQLQNLYFDKMGEALQISL